MVSFDSGTPVSRDSAYAATVDVEPAIPSLIDALDEDFEYSRANACWALGYLEADAALDALEERRTADSSEEVRHAADQAIQMIEKNS